MCGDTSWNVCGKKPLLNTIELLCMPVISVLNGVSHTISSIKIPKVINPYPMDLYSWD